MPQTPDIGKMACGITPSGVFRLFCSMVAGMFFFPRKVHTGLPDLLHQFARDHATAISILGLLPDNVGTFSGLPRQKTKGIAQLSMAGAWAIRF